MTDEESRLRLLQILEGHGQSAYDRRRALNRELVEKYLLLVRLGVDESAAADYLSGIGPRPPQDPDGSVRGDLPGRLRALPPRRDLIPLRSAGPTPAAEYFRWKPAARREAMVPGFSMRRLERDHALYAELFDLSSLEDQLAWDVARGASGPEAAGRAERAREVYSRLLAACRPRGPAVEGGPG